MAESSFIREIGASCTSPVGVFAVTCGTELTVKAIIADYRENSSSCCGKNNSGVDRFIFENVRKGRIVIDVKDAEKVGEMLLKSMKHAYDHDAVPYEKNNIWDVEE
jgi:porphobilinogen deaminase